MSMQQGIDIIYFDFRKVFYSVSHQKPLIKLQACGFSDILLSWLEAFLSNQTQAVKVNCYLSNTGDVISGVLQGSVLGLFLIYIKDAADTLAETSVKLKLFADDI